MGDRSSPPPDLPSELLPVLRSAAKLQRAVPEAVLVGGSAAAWYAHHRTSFDHDHVLPDLVDRYAIVLDACEATEGWATNVRASRPPLTLLGELDGIEAGLRQLRRTVPLEVTEARLPDQTVLRVPTLAETLRVKAFLVVQRNRTRDYLDVAALADRAGEARAAEILARLDDYYVDRSGEWGSAGSALVSRLAHPQPRDHRVTTELPRYKQLEPRWHDWGAVVEACGNLAVAVVQAVSEPSGAEDG